MKYKRQKKQLLNLLSNVSNLDHNLAELGCFIAGGAITSIFTGKEVNDLDVYFRNKETLVAFIEMVFNTHKDNKPCNLGFLGSSDQTVNLNSYELRYVGHTKKSIILVDSSGQEVQLIINRFYDSPQDIFDSFDFHLNMGCFDFKEDKFVLSDNFLTDNASRTMTVNPNTSFPIISQLRIAKYLERGYTISRKEFITLACAVTQLNFTSWEDVKEAIGGLYGYCVDDIFDETVEFTMNVLFEQLVELEANDQRFTGLDRFPDEKGLIEFVEKLHE